jgi:hypothetical protein
MQCFLFGAHFRRRQAFAGFFTHMAFVFDIGERFAFVSGIRFDAFQEERRWRGTAGMSRGSYNSDRTRDCDRNSDADPKATLTNQSNAHRVHPVRGSDFG